jgi:magnesium transporter
MIRSLVAPSDVLEEEDEESPEKPSEEGEAEEEEFTLRRNLSEESLEEAYVDGCLIWIDILDAEEDELKWLGNLLNLHPAVAGDLRRTDRRPTLYVYPDYLFLSMFEAHMKQTQVEADEIHVIIGEHYLITVRNESATAINNAYDRAAQNNSYWERGVVYLLYLTMQFVVDSYYPLIDRISNQLNKLEESAMINGDRSLQKSVFRLKQQLINLRQMVAPQREVISNAIGEERLTSSQDDRDLFHHLYERLLRVYDVIDSQRDLASNVLDLIESQESSNLAKAVGRLTVLSMIFLPPTFIVGLFGLNFVTTNPEFEIPLSGGLLFASIILLTLIMSAGIAWFFKRQGWL